MIIKGKSRNNAAQAGSYLLKQGKNERVELIETRGTLAQDVKGACAEMEALAAGSNAEKPFYHASINPAKGERLTPEQWEISTNLLEKKLGLEGHQRIIVEHEKNGDIHRHIFWNRVNQETLVAVRMGWNYVQHERTAREIENAFDLQKVQGVHVKENGELREKDDPLTKRGPDHDKMAESKRTGVNLYKWRDEIRHIASRAGDGADLIAALEAKGHMVAKGRKCTVILDPSGTPQRMAQNLDFGIRSGEFANRMKGIDLAALPSVEQARELQKARLAEIEKTKTEQKDAPATFGQKDVLKQLYAQEKIRQQEAIKEIGNTAEDGISFVIAMQDKGFQVAKNKYGYLTAVNSKGFEFSLKTTKEAIFEDIAELQKNGVVIPSSDQVREEQKLGKEEQRRLRAEKREKYQQEKELFHHRLFATSYKNGGMASQERDAIYEAKRRNRAINAPRPLHPDEHAAKQQSKNALPELKKKQQPAQAATAKEVFTPQPLQKREKNGETEKEKQVEARTEQTDGKKKKSAGDITREIHEAKLNRLAEQMHNAGIHSQKEKSRVQER